jgi:hypothetical protein
VRSPAARGSGQLEELMAQGDGFGKVHIHRPLGVFAEAPYADFLGGFGSVRRRLT